MAFITDELMQELEVMESKVDESMELSDVEKVEIKQAILELTNTLRVVGER